MLEITVKTLDSRNHTFTCLDDMMTVHSFKEYIADVVSVPVESQRLIYCGRVLQDDKKLTDYGNVNGKVIHLVQRAPPQPESRSTSSDNQRQNNNQQWAPRVHYRGHLPRNAMYLGAMSMPAEVVEGLQTPQLSNTLSLSRLRSARCMLNKAAQLIDRMDDPAVPLHPSPTDPNVPEPSYAQMPVADDDGDQDSNLNSPAVMNTANSIARGIVYDRMARAASRLAAALPATALINIRLSHDNSVDAESVNLLNSNQSEQTGQDQAQRLESENSQSEPQRPNADAAAPEQSESDGTVREESDTARPEASTSDNNENPPRRRRRLPRLPFMDDTRTPGASGRRRPNRFPRPPRMAELLETLVSTQGRLRPYIERYRVLMLADPSLTPGNGPEGVMENQKIVDGVSECLHYLSHACHALSDIIVDMGQQPPRNLRCRPILIQQSAILQTGPIEIESHINLTPGRNVPSNNNTTDEGNEATRPSSPTSGTSDQNSRSSNTNNRQTPQGENGQQSQPSLLGTLLNLPSNVELSMELSPQSAMDLSSPSAADGSENEQGQSGGAGNLYSIQPFAFIREALQNALSERHAQMDTSNGSLLNAATNIPIVTIVGQQMDIITSNSGQSTQARSNIGTHPTTSTQTRSTARPHVLHPHTHALDVGMNIGQNWDFDPFLPCNSHHVRRTPVTITTSTSTSTSASQSTSATSTSQTTSATSASQESQTNQSSTSETPTRSNTATAPKATPARNVSQGQTDDEDNDDEDEDDGNELRRMPLTSDRLREMWPLQSSNGRPSAGVVGNTYNMTFNYSSDEYTGEDFIADLWVFFSRNITFGDSMLLWLGEQMPLVNLRHPFREFLEQFFRNATPATLQQQVVDQFISSIRPYFQHFDVSEDQTVVKGVDIPATVESLLRKFCTEFIKLLFNNDLNDTAFAQEAVTLTEKLADQSSAILQYVLGENIQPVLETIAPRLARAVNIEVPTLWTSFLSVTYVARGSDMTEEQIKSLVVYKEPSASPTDASAMTEETKSEPNIKQETRPLEQQADKEPQGQAEQQQSVLKQKVEETKEVKPEPMETEVLDNKLIDDPMDLANGEDIPETFPGAENLPAEWVPIIARDSVRQRRQAQVNALQGGPMPFSDAYLSCLPSKRRKLIEQQKPQLLVNPTANSTAITASVERLVREGIAHSHVEEAEGAANAVASAPAVRNAFGQAIKDCIHPARLHTPDFPNSRRFPNATKLFADGDKDKEVTKPSK